MKGKKKVKKENVGRKIKRQEEINKADLSMENKDKNYKQK